LQGTSRGPDNQIHALGLCRGRAPQLRAPKNQRHNEPCPKGKAEHIEAVQNGAMTNARDHETGKIHAPRLSTGARWTSWGARSRSR
jgi:hypothetical protein